MANDTILLPLHIIYAAAMVVARDAMLVYYWYESEHFFFLFDHFLCLGPIVDTSVKFHSCIMMFMVAIRLLGGASSH